MTISNDDVNTTNQKHPPTATFQSRLQIKKKAFAAGLWGLSPQYIANYFMWKSFVKICLSSCSETMTPLINGFFPCHNYNWFCNVINCQKLVSRDYCGHIHYPVKVSQYLGIVCLPVSCIPLEDFEMSKEFVLSQKLCILR